MDVPSAVWCRAMSMASLLDRRRCGDVGSCLRWGVVGIAAVAVLLAGCSTPSSMNAAAAPTAPRTWRTVALGDSVPYGSNCDCTPYPHLTSDGLAASTSQTVTATNDAVGGYTTSDVLKQLQSDTAVIAHVREADAVEIEVGANDVLRSDTCGDVSSCYAPGVATVDKNLNAIVARVHELTAGHKIIVVLLDYWSVWLGGTYATEQGNAYETAATTVTNDVNTVIKSNATATGSAYVDLRAAFKGPDYAYDETHYLSDDGDHPNAAGHQQIATATELVIKSALHI